MDPEQLCSEVVLLKLLDLYWSDNQYCQYCQYICSLLFNTYLFMDSDITGTHSQTKEEFQVFFKFCGNVHFD